MGVCIEPREYVIGLEHFETWVHRTRPEGVRSEAGDLDFVVNSLRKYARLALKGNPTVLLLLFVNPDDLLLRTPLGDELQTLAPAVIRAAPGIRSWATSAPRSSASSAMRTEAREATPCRRSYSSGGHRQGPFARGGGVRVIVRAGSTFTPALLCEESLAPTRP
jgi:hypothetical protein